MDDDAPSRKDHRTASTDDAVRKLGEILEEMRADGRRRDQVLEDQRRATEDQRRAIEDQRQAIEDQRLAANQWNLRQERMMQELLAGAQQLTANIREWRYEGVAEARAQRAALFAILDELKGRGGPATA